MQLDIETNKVKCKFLDINKDMLRKLMTNTKNIGEMSTIVSIKTIHDTNRIYLF